MSEIDKNNILSVKDLEYSYPNGTKALCGVTLEIKAGERIALLGSNGSGKSTLFLCLNGVYKAKAGQILFDGVPVTYDKKCLTHLRKEVGVVFQDAETQIFCVDVFQEAAFGPYNLGWPPERVQEAALQSLTAMNLLELKDTPPHFLSGGQKKRVTVASVLSMEPSVLLVDEPVSSLDPEHARRLMDEMEQLSARGVTILMATHDVDGALAWADRAILMRDGRIEADAPPLEVFLDDALLARCGLETPSVLRIWKALRSRNFVTNVTPPRSAEELERLIAGQVK